MQIHAVGTQPVSAFHSNRPQLAEASSSRQSVTAPSGETEPMPAPPPDEVKPPKGHAHGRAGDAHVPGVVRLLEAGHFRGVSDVRLRINFNDQLTARAQAGAEPVVAAGATRLGETVTAAAEGLLASYAADDEARAALSELLDTFSVSVEAAGSGATANGAIDAGELEASLQSAFDDMVGGLEALFATPVDEPPAGDVDVPVDGTGVDGVADPLAPTPIDAGGALAQPLAAGVAGESVPVEVEPEAEAADPEAGVTTTTLDEALAALTDMFREALSTLLTSVDSALRLPEPSAPHGNGAAFEKFLAIYRDLQNGVAVDEVG